MAFPGPGLRPGLFVYNNKQGTIMKRIMLCALIDTTPSRIKPEPDAEDLIVFAEDQVWIPE
jgi:hypothetical protein